MTAEQRQHLRRQIDHHKRTTLDAYRRARPGNFCNGCGGELHDKTPGCANCYDRARRQQRAAYERRKRLERIAENNSATVRLLRRRERLCTRCGRPHDDPTPIPKNVCVNCWDRQRQRRYKAS